MKRCMFGFFIIIMMGTQIAGASQPADSVINRDAAGEPQIQLKYRAFDPLRGEPRISSVLKSLPFDPVKLIQVNGPMTSKWITAQEEKGVIFLSYLPDFTYIAVLTPALEREISVIPEVRWIGDFHPVYKIQAGLLERPGRNEVNLLLWPDFDDKNHQASIREKILSLAAPLTFEESGNSVLRANLTREDIVEMARRPEVHWIDRYDPPRALMNLIREFTGASRAASPGGFDGEGIVGEVKDDGCDTDHPDFANLMGTYGGVSTRAHGTCTFGIVFSDHDGNARGMMYNGGGIFADWYTSRDASIQNLKNAWGGVFQSNSWSQGSQNGDYSTYSQQDDQAVNTYDVMMFYAAGNSDYGVGSQTITQDSAGKNVVSVGAIYHHNTSNFGDDEWHNGGTGNTPSQGPARDGRIKPDLCGVFDSIYTTDVEGTGGYAAGNYTPGFGGTSGATPIVAGAAGLVYQMYKENHFGNNPGGALPHAPTVKALLIANAHQYLMGRANRYQQGWGLVDVGQVFDAGPNHVIIDGTDPLQTGGSTAYQVERAGPSTPLKIVLCWSDKPGETSAAQALINDLDLKVTAPDAAVYYGNEGLAGNLYSTAGGDYDRLNNVECVFIQNPLAGTYEIEVTAYNIAQDNDPQMGVNQAYALVASECDTGGGDETCLIAGAGAGPANEPRIQGFTADGVWNGMTDFSAFSGGRYYGVNLAAGDIQNDGDEDIIAGMGPGPDQPPQFRAFNLDGTQIPGCSILAYGTPSWGVHVGTGDLNGSGRSEILTGAGPASAYRPHVRAWKYENDTLVPENQVNFIIARNARWGIHVAAADIDGDGFDEILTGAGPGPQYGPHVRGFNYDGVTLTPMNAVNFFAYNVRRYGVKVSGGHVADMDRADILTAPGRGPVFGPHIRGFSLQDSEVRPLQGLSFFAYNSQLKYGASVSGGDINRDGLEEILTGPGPGQTYGAYVRAWRYNGGSVQEIIGFMAFQGLNYKYGAQAAAGRF